MEWGGPCCQTGTRPGGTASLRAPTPHDRCIGNAHNIAAAQPCGKKWGSPGASFITHCAMKEDPQGPCRHPSCLGPTPVGSPLDPPQDFGVFLPRLSIRDISPRLCRRHFKMAGDPVMSLICWGGSLICCGVYCQDISWLLLYLHPLVILHPVLFCGVFPYALRGRTTTSTRPPYPRD